MHAPSSLAETAMSPGTKGTRLQGRWLVLARVVWVAIVVFTLSIFLLSLPAYFAQLQTICAGVACVYAYGQLTPGTAQALQHLGLSIGAYAASTLAIAIAPVLVFFGVAGLIFWRRFDDWMALLVSLFLVTFGVNFSAQGLLAASLQTAWNVPLSIVTALGWISFNLLIYLFPDGRFVPRWTRLVAVFAIASNLFLNTFPQAFFNLPSWVAGVLFTGLAVTGVVAQIYRYLRISGPVQRQQTKWVVFGIAATGVVIMGRYAPLLFFPALSTSSSLYFLILVYVSPLGYLLIPLTLGMAILRYRLWDIDILINRTLVYGMLTALLALVYIGLVVALQAFFKAITGQVGTSPLVIVISTLAIAALVQPLRHRLQKIIDRRFYRRKYDATRTLAAFSATLQNEMDLNQLSEHLLVVVKETMQPTFVSLWLRTPSQKRTSNQQSHLNSVFEKQENAPEGNEQL